MARCRDLRELVGWSRADVARMAGVSVSVVRKLEERSAFAVRERERSRIARVLGVPSAELFLVEDLERV